MTSEIPGNIPSTVIVTPATPEQCARMRERLDRIRTTARERGLHPAAASSRMGRPRASSGGAVMGLVASPSMAP